MSYRFLVICVVTGMLVVSAVASSVQADTSWALLPPDSGNWSIPENWTDGVPDSLDAVSISNGGTATVTSLGEACGGFLVDHGSRLVISSGSLNVGNPDTGGWPVTGWTIARSGSVLMNGGTLSVPSSDYNTYVGRDAAASFTQTGGRNAFGMYLYLGNYSGGSGTYNLSGTGVLSGECVIVGYEGAGAFTQSGGIVNASVSIGLSGTSTGTYSMTGGQIVTPFGGFLHVGRGGMATFDQSAGEIRCDGDVSVALGSTYRLSGDSKLTVGITLAGRTEIGGIFDQSGGTHFAYYMDLISSGDNSASYILSGGSLTCVDQTVGMIGNATFTQTGGVNDVQNGALYVGRSGPGVATYDLSGNGQLQAVRYEYIGEDYNASGIFNQSGGTNTVVERLVIGNYSSAKGEYNLSGGLLSVSGYIGAVVGSAGTGTFLQSGGTASISLLTVGESGCGTFTQTAGVTTVSSAFCLAKYAGSSGTYQLNGGTLSVASISDGSGTKVFDFGGGTLQSRGAVATAMPMTLTGIGGDANVDTAGFSLSLFGPVSGPGGLSKFGAGTLLISHANDYSGSTAVHAGVLHLAMRGRQFDTPGKLSVAGGATLILGYGGAGAFTSEDIDSLQSNGSLAPGACLGFDTTNAGGSALYAGSLGGDLSIVKCGAGTLTLSAAQGILGTTAVTGGALRLGHQSAIATSTFIGGAGALAFDSGVSDHAFTLGGLSGACSIDLRDDAGNPVVLSVGNNGASTTFAGTLSGAGGLTKIGAGTLTLSGANAHSGPTTISAGTLLLQNSNAIANSTLADGAGSLAFSSSVGTHAFVAGGLDGSTNLDLTDSAGNPVSLTVGGNGENTVYTGVLSGGGVLTKTGSGTLTLGNANLLTGGITLNGGQLNIGNAQALGAGTFTIAGTATFDNATSGPLTLSTNNTIWLSTNATFIGTQDLNLGSGIYIIGLGKRTIAVHANTLTIGGEIRGGGAMTKDGNGRLVLAVANAYSGTTTVVAGTLVAANNTGSATGMKGVTVCSGATLSGPGIISGSVTVAGTLAPGDGVGILTINNRVTFQSGATFAAEIYGLNAGTGYDELTTSGPVSLAGSLALSFGSLTPSNDDIFFLINNTGAEAIAGTFQYADDGKVATFNGYNWYITYDANNSATPSLNGGNDVALYCRAVPEPGTLALLATAALSLLALSRRRKSA